ncbi:MAG: hypothetical protein GX221_05440 [Candidatus Riflebacteria bacterium]|nr:hypothetical protein [Candidatus Riflebacteria bacterium]
MKFKSLMLVLAAIACAFPAFADKYMPQFPSPAEFSLKMTGNKGNLYNFDVFFKPVIGSARNIVLHFKVLSPKKAHLSANSAVIISLKEKEVFNYKFSVLLENELKRGERVNVQASVKYLPDYQELINYVLDAPEDKYTVIDKDYFIERYKSALRHPVRTVDAVRWISKSF